MRKHFKNDCSNCHEYPYECDDCCSEVKASINQKTRHHGKKDPCSRSKYVINNN